MTTDSQHWHSVCASVCFSFFGHINGSAVVRFGIGLFFFLLLMFHYLIACCANRTTGSFNKQNVLALCVRSLCFGFGALCSYYSFSILLLWIVQCFNCSHETWVCQRERTVGSVVRCSLQIKHLVGHLLHAYTIPNTIHKVHRTRHGKWCFDIYFTHSLHSNWFCWSKKCSI